MRVFGGCLIYVSGGKMGKTQYRNDSTQSWTNNAQGSEGLINFSQGIEFKGEHREDLVREVNKTVMGVSFQAAW